MRTIERLTAEQELQATKLVADWRAEDLSTEPIDRVQTVHAINRFYRLFGAEPPQIIFAQSPFQLMLLPMIYHRVKNAELSIQSLRELGAKRLAESFDAAAWPVMEQCLWQTADKMLTQLSSVKLAFDEDGLLPLAIPGENYTAFKARKPGSGTVAGGLGVRFRDLTNKMFSRASARMDELLVIQLRSELLQTDRPRASNRGVDGTPRQEGSSATLTRQAAVALSFQINGRLFGNEDAAIIRHTWYGRWGCEWLLFYQFIRKFIAADFFEQEMDEEFEIWLGLARGGIAYQFFESVCFVCTEPSVLRVDDLSRLHSDSGYALQFPDLYGLHSWHGVTVPMYVIEEPSTITVEDIESDVNAEIKRIKIQIYGEERYLQNSDHKVLDESTFGTLIRKEIDRDEPLVMVRVKNSTAELEGTFKYYYLRVPPQVATAREAVAWTFGMNESDYELQEES